MATAKKKRKTRETFGRIDKLPSGRFRARYVGLDGELYAARHDDGRPHTFDSLTDARGWLASVHAQISAGTWVPPHIRAANAATATETLGAYATRWLETNRNRRGEPLRPRTKAEYGRLLRQPDPTREGDKGGPLATLAIMPLAAITVDDVDTWYAEQSASGKLTQASRAYSLLSTILGHAVERGRISANPCKVRGAQSARTGKKVVPPSDAELAKMIAALPPQLRALVWVAAEGGLRWGEATELRRDDVEVERDESGQVYRVLVKVERAVSRVKGEFIVGTPKSSAGVRAVYIYGDAADAIARHLREHVSRFGNALLFPAIGDETGQRHLSQSTFHTPWWRDARDAAKRSDMPFHALRHRAGTAYMQHGATLAEAMARLGHGSAAVAMRYQHATDRDAEIAARMAKRSSSTA